MKNALGKGLNALMGEHVQKQDGYVSEVDIFLIDNDANQPRKSFDEEKLHELAQSIEVHGIMQPIIVQENGDRYTIVSGERRFRAAKIAGLKKVPVLMRDITERERAELALIENIQREDLNAMEQAAALQDLVTNYELTQEEVAARVGKNRSTIANLMRLLSLPGDVQQLVRDNTISAGHARCLLALGSTQAIKNAADAVCSKGLSVRQTEELVKKLQNPEKKDNVPKKPLKISAELWDAQESLSETLETKVKIQGDTNKGKIVIDYYNKEQLQQLFDAMTGGSN